MYRMAASRLKGGAIPRGLTRYASTSAVATKSSLGSLFGWLTGEKSSSILPLDIPLKDVTDAPPLLDYVEPAKTVITTLENGLQIASENSVNPGASIGLYVDCGSIYEKPDSFGASHLLERMAFKSTTNRSHLRIVRELEAIGGNITASTSREHMSYTCNALKTYVPHMLEILVDCVRNPAFLDWEVSEQIKNMKAEIKELSKDPQNVLMEAIHATAYSGRYANALIASEASLNRLTPDLLEQFVTENYTASRMVLAASGVDHDTLLQYAKPILSDLPFVERPSLSIPCYKGGDFRLSGESGTTHFALAFELREGWLNDKEAMILTVLQMLMGGGGSFSAGGPGKGMYSRLYLRVLNQFPQFQSCTAFTSIYNTSGLFGIQVTTEADFASSAVDIVCDQLLDVATPGGVEKLALDRAKKATKSSILMNLESRVIVLEDMGKQVLAYGKRKEVDYFLGVVDEVTVEDIAKITQKLLCTGLTMASYGDLHRMPSYESISPRFTR